MRKICLLLVPILVGTILFVGCGKNEKKAELLTGGVVLSAEAQGEASSFAASASQQAIEIVRAITCGTEASPTKRAMKFIEGEYDGDVGLEDWFKPDADGWSGFSDGGMEFKVRSKNANGDIITSWGDVELQVKTTEIKISGSDSGNSFSVYLIETYDEVGNQSSDSTISGSMTYDSGDETSNISLTNIRVSDGQYVTSGTISVNVNSPTYGIWTVNLTYSADSSADGTIAGPGYSATIHVNADGTGTYTDASGTHAIA